MKRATILTLLALVWLLFVPVAWAQEEGYDLDWWTLDGGGASSPSGTGYTLGGTVGQPDAAVWQDAGYTLSGGFWLTGPAVAGYEVFLPVVIRSSGP